MPYNIVPNSDKCPASKPFAVIGGRSGDDLFGCHATKESAREQQKALYAAEGNSAGRASVTHQFTYSSP
jgi:hypothetical protein